MKISIATITKDFDSLDPINEFLENAIKYNHKLYSVIIIYSNNCNFKLIECLRKKIKVFPVKVNASPETRGLLNSLGLTKENINTLLYSPYLQECGLVPYGMSRNYALIKALLIGSDAVVFIDTDVYPRVLVKEGNEIKEKEIDFIGRHLEFLKEEDVMITTSDYSGYYIVPPMNFPGIKELFHGLQKEEAYEFLKYSDEHYCLNLDNNEKRQAFNTSKILGGNVAIKLTVLKELEPFFSTVYNVGGENFLSRGEDTLMGIKFKNNEKTCIDIDTKIFHDTFGDFPKKPDIQTDNKIKERFYYACLGWIGRNPFLNWLKGVDIEEVKNKQKQSLLTGSKSLASYLEDNRFLILPEALEIAYSDLKRVINEYENTMKVWNNMLEKLTDWESDK